jgi:nucleosome-remodeling factor subunit BPTF
MTTEQPPHSMLQQLKPAPLPASPIQPTTPSTPASGPSPQQKVQIVRSNDGKIQVRGLLPGQQLVQTPDGKLQIITQTVMKSNAGSPVVGSTPASPIATGVIQGQNKTVMQPNAVVPSHFKQQVLPPPAPTTLQQQQQIIGSPVKTGSAVNAVPNTTSTAPNQILATQLAPGSQIPPGTTVFVSGGKTYCIPKATATLAGGAQLPQHPVTNLTLASPTNTTPSVATALTTASPQITSTTPTPAVQQPKQMVEVKTLGQNVVSFKGSQMIVQGPDIAQAQHIARQLSSGAARLAMLNGKQVLISTTPTIIQQPQQQQTVQQQTVQMVQQQTQPSQIVQQQQILSPVIQPLQVQPTLPPQILQSSPIKNDLLENVKLPTEPLPPPQLSSEPEQAAAALPQSPAKPPLQITAQLVQTPQGPRIILQGIQGASLPKQYLLSIQQQVKTQLLKAQAEAKQQNRVPPTKIVIQLPASIQAQLENDQSKPTPAQHPSVTLPTQPIAPAPSVLMSPLTAAPPTQVINSIRSPRPLAPQTPTSIGSPRPVVLHQIGNTNQGQRFVLIGSSGAKMAMIASPGSQGVNNLTPQSSATDKPLSVLLPNTPHPPSMIFSNASNSATTNLTGSQLVTSLMSPNSAMLANDNSDKFELTPDYIQKAISDALKSQNLSPEIEQKLLALQHHTNEKGVSTPVSSTKKAVTPIDPLTGEPMDEEWEPTSRPRSGAGGRKRKPALVPAPTSDSAESFSPSVTSPTPAPAPRAPATPPRSRSKSGQKSGGQINVVSGISGTNAVLEEKKRQQALNKLQQMLVRHKEQLKKDIARKRSQQEKDLQIDIHRTIEKAKLDHQVRLRFPLLRKCFEIFGGKVV